jgi:hypothetical protein
MQASGRVTLRAVYKWFVPVPTRSSEMGANQRVLAVMVWTLLIRLLRRR